MNVDIYEITEDQVREIERDSGGQFWQDFFKNEGSVPTWFLERFAGVLNWVSLSLWSLFDDRQLEKFQDKIVWRHLATWYPFTLKQLKRWQEKLSKTNSITGANGWLNYASENPHFNREALATFHQFMPWTDKAFLARLSVGAPVSE